MKAIEFETIIKGKTIEIPDAYAEWSEKPVRVILLREDEVTNLRQQQLNKQPVYHDLDALAGTWTDQQAREFLDTLADFSKVDEEMWR